MADLALPGVPDLEWVLPLLGVRSTLALRTALELGGFMDRPLLFSLHSDSEAMLCCKTGHTCDTILLVQFVFKTTRPVTIKSLKKIH